MSRQALALALVVLAGCWIAPAGPEPERQPPVPRGTGALVVQNDSELVIFRVRLALVGEPEWGPDRLDGSEVMKPGARHSWEVGCGLYNVQVEFKDGSILEGDESYVVRPDDEAVCVIRKASAADVGTLTIVNGTGYAICRLYVSPTNRIGWGEDRLVGNQVLAPRKRHSWQMPAGSYNLKVEFQDGTALEGEGAYQVVAGEDAVYHLGRE